MRFLSQLTWNRLPSEEIMALLPAEQGIPEAVY